jgi:hypothetical protein
MPTDSGLDKNRSEIAGPLHANGSTIHLTYDWTIEPGAANDATWLCAGQLRQALNDSWSPPFSIDLSGEKMTVDVDVAGNNANAWSYYKSIYTDSQNIVRGHAYHMDITVKFDMVSGFATIVRDGVTIANYQGPLGYSAMGSGVYWKEGIYRHEAASTQVMDYSHLTITTSP